MTATPIHWCLDTDRVGDVTVVRFTGRQVRLGEEHLRLVEEYLFGRRPNLDGREVLLDFGNVECLASTALARLVLLHEKLAAADRHLRLDGLRPHVYEVLEVVQLDKVLDAHKAEPMPRSSEQVPEPAHVP
jgi:anti-anti-sigma regulatory factor